MTSLDEFKLLYENDLGLPDFLSDSNQWKLAGGYNISDPVNAAEVLLGIAPAVSQVEGSNQDAAPYNDIRKVTFTFKDNSKVVVTMINQFGQGWLPQDWTDGSGVRSRTAADLAQQYARGVLHKSAQYIFPILTPGRSERPYRAADGYDRRRAVDVEIRSVLAVCNGFRACTHR